MNKRYICVGMDPYIEVNLVSEQAIDLIGEGRKIWKKFVSDIHEKKGFLLGLHSKRENILFSHECGKMFYFLDNLSLSIEIKWQLPFNLKIPG